MPVIVIGEVDTRLLDLGIAQRMEYALGNHRGTVIDSHDLALDDRRYDQIDDLLDGDLRLVEHFGNHDHRIMAGRADTESEMSGRTSHSSHDEPIAARAGIGIDRAADDRPHVLGRLVTERRRAGRKRQVVVDRFGNMNIGDRIFFGLEELGDAVGRRRRIVAPDGDEQFDVILDEQVQIEILLEVLVRRFEAAHRQERSAPVENIVRQQEIDLRNTRILRKQARISAVQAQHAIALLEESLRHAAHNGIHPGGGTAARQNCNCIHLRLL